jgi:hypothetical protein
MLTDKLVSFFLCLTFEFECIPLPTPPPRWVHDPPLDPSMRWVHELLTDSLWCGSMAVWGSYRYSLCIFERIGRWETGELPVLFVRDSVQHAIHHSLTTSLGIRLFSSLLFVCPPYLASPGCPLGSLYIGLLKPLDGWGWDEGTAVWRSYRYPLRVLECVDPWVMSAPPLLFVRDGVIHAVHRLLMTTLIR